MKLKVKTKELLNACKIAGFASAKRTTAPSLNALLIESNDGTLTVTGSNIATFIKVKCPCEMEKPGAIGVPAAIFQHHLSNIQSDTVELDMDNRTLVVKADGVARFGVLEKKDFNNFPNFSPVLSVVAPECDIRNGFAKVKPAIGEDVARPFIETALVEVKDLKFQFTATLGNAVLHTYFPQDGDGLTASALVPAELVAMIVQSLDEKSPRELKFSFSDKAILLETDSVTIHGQLMEGKFPPWEQVIPAPVDRPIKVPRQAMIQAIRSVRPFTNAVFFPIALRFGVDSVTVSNLGGEHGVERPVAIEDGADIRIVLNPDYLEKFLLSMTGEKVDFHLYDAMGPLLMRCESMLGVISLCHGV